MEVEWGGAWHPSSSTISEDDLEGLIVFGIGDLTEILGESALGVAIPVQPNATTLDGGVLVGLDPITTELAGQTDYEVFVHEMIHALGLLGHVPSGRYGPDELMDNRARLVRNVKEHHYLSVVHHYDPNYLGGWNGDYELLRGDTGDVGYEVWVMNDSLAWPIYGFGSGVLRRPRSSNSRILSLSRARHSTNCGPVSPDGTRNGEASSRADWGCASVVGDSPAVSGCSGAETA